MSEEKIYDNIGASEDTTLDNDDYVAPKKGARDSWLRWLMLTFGNFFLFGSYYCYDIPSALSIYLSEEPYNISEVKYNLLYSVYSFPNMILPLIGGILCDKIGIKVSLMMFTTLVTIGQLVFTFGGVYNNYPLMLAGRFIFGLGGECQFVCKSAIISQWFKGKELAFAFGLNLSFARLGSVVASLIEPHVAQESGLGPALWVGFGFCAMSWFCGIGIVLCEMYAEKVDGKTAKLSDEDKFKCKQLTEFSVPFWLITCSCVTVYCSIFPYSQNTPVMLNKEFKVPVNTASAFSSVPFLISAGIAPFLGICVDKIGKRALFVAISSFMVVLACIFTMILVKQEYAETSYTCLGPLILLGFGYSIYASSLWPSIPLVVKPHTLATAFGVCTSFQQIGLMVVPYAVGLTLHENISPDHPYYGYVNEQILLGSIAFFGFMVNVGLYFDDIKNRGGLLDKVSVKEASVMAAMSAEIDEHATEIMDGVDEPTDVNQGGVIEVAEMRESMITSYKTSKEDQDLLKRSVLKQSFRR